MDNPIKTLVEKVSKAWNPPFQQSFQLFQKRRRDNRLVKSRPVSLEDQYHLLENEAQIDQAFERIREHFFTAVEVNHLRNPQAHAYHCEHGKFSATRRYFYIKPPAETGWLFERSGYGWVVSRADKIVSQSLFLRSNEASDAVTVYKRDGSELVRLFSQAMQPNFVAIPVYQQTLLRWMGLKDISELLGRQR